MIRDAGLECCFDSFRAPISSPFHFDDYFRAINGSYPTHLATSGLRRGPQLEDVTALQFAFGLLENHKTRLSLIDCLITATRCKETSLWPVGHFIVFKGMAQHSIYYVGSGKPKLIFLIVGDIYGEPYFWVIGASAYDAPVIVGQGVPCLRLLRLLDKRTKLMKLATLNADRAS